MAGAAVPPSSCRTASSHASLLFPSRNSPNNSSVAARSAGPAGQPAGEEQIAEAYRLLEVEPSSSDEQVVKAYRRQMSRHHPDKLQANGVPESMLEHAKERTQQIRAAYELIRTRRGMS